MKKNFGLNLPINSVSFGQVSIGILKEIFRRKLEPSLFLIGNQADLSTHSQDENFSDWIKNCINKGLKDHKRSDPVFKLWHINGSLESYSDKQILLTFYELDEPTAEEINILKNNSKVLVTSEYTKSIFNNNHVLNTDYLPLAFDKESFYVKNNSIDDRITFNVVGKLERRKHHGKIIKSWAAKYGNNKKYFLNCAIYNPFIKKEDQERIISNLLENKKFFNINFLGFMPTNQMYNDYLNSGDVIIGLSGGEGWGLPEFTSTCLGKQAIILNAHGYKGWANKDNSILVEPTGKIESYDNIFFKKGAIYNQGNIFDFDYNDFLSSCDEAIKRVESKKQNEAGLKMQNIFTFEKLTENVLSYL